MPDLFSDTGSYDPRNEFNRIWAAIRSLQTAPTLEHSSIGQEGLRVHGGRIVIDQRGALQVVTDDGEVLVNLGDEVGFGGISQGWRLNYANGERAIALGGDEDAQVWQMWDGAGNYVVTNDGITGVGLARPYLGHCLTPTEDAEPGPSYLWPSTTSTTPTELLSVVTTVWNPRLEFSVDVRTDGGGTGNWRFVMQWPEGSQTIVDNQTDFGVFQRSIPGWGAGVVPGHAVRFVVEAWASDSAERVYVRCERCFGLQSATS